MDIPSPPQAVAALASFVRDRLSEVSGTIAPLLIRGGQLDVVPVTEHDRSVIDQARQLAGVIVGAAAPFAPTAYSRARLIRQMHASGLLTDDEVRRTAIVLDAEERTVEERTVEDRVGEDRTAAGRTAEPAGAGTRRAPRPW
ncbi:hypothetical protein [uncultured Jatrophihabitans sp.]|uniref:hypothetical protein n=1 Tax=uncultured Jatrophihabitans sp. TaxID=1610747 RepID=UPI0035CC5BD0